MALAASSSSSNQTAMLAKAALCQVCRLERPSSNSPIRLAASSATVETTSAVSFREPSALPQQRGRGQIIRDPDRLEIGGEEEPAGAEHVVLIGKVQVGLIGLEQLTGPFPGSLMIRQHRDRGELGSAPRQPEVLIVRPGAIVALTAVSLLTTGATMFGPGSRG